MFTFFVFGFCFYRHIIRAFDLSVPLPQKCHYTKPEYEASQHRCTSTTFTSKHLIGPLRLAVIWMGDGNGKRRRRAFDEIRFQVARKSAEWRNKRPAHSFIACIAVSAPQCLCVVMPLQPLRHTHTHFYWPNERETFAFAFNLMDFRTNLCEYTLFP